MQAMPGGKKPLPRRTGRRAGRRGRARVAAVAGLSLLAAGLAAASPPLLVTGMTYVGRQGTASELVLHSESAVFHPDTEMAELEGVRAVMVDDKASDSFEMTCDRAELNVATNDFTARGNVEGVTGDGQRYSAPWVKYEHASSLLHTDAPVLVVNDTGTFRGDGFRYHVQERRFRLLGNVRVVQTP